MRKVAVFLALVIAFAASAGMVNTGGSRAFTASSFLLAAGHAVPAKVALSVVYPRPDAESSTNARHRKAYYDGSNAFEYRIPVGVQFGSFPYRYSIVSGPSGMTIGGTYGSSNYGVVTWTPSGSVSGASVDVLVEDQDSNSIHVTWTVTTSSSTTDFLFFAPGGNDTTGTGAIGNPYQTLTKLFGLGANGAAVAVFRTGTFSLPSGTNTMTSVKPRAFMAFPGETATWDFTNGVLYSASLSDTFFDNLTFDGGRTGVNNMQSFINDGATARHTISRIIVTNPKNGTLVDDNASVFVFANPGSATYTTYIYVVDSQETGRTSGGNNNLICLGLFFQPQNSLAERNYIECPAGHALWWKSSADKVTRRKNTIVSTSGEAAMTDPNQVNNGLTTDKIEDCYNTLIRTSGATEIVSMNWGNLATTGERWFYRNSVYNGKIDIRTPNTTNGPFNIEKNAVQAGSPQITKLSGAVSGSNIVVSDTECHGTSSILDSAGLLIGTCQSTWRGLRGAEIQ